jgi:thioredoxin-like negative regulator of GroEL
MLAQAKGNMEEEKIYEASQFVKLALFHNPRSAEAHHLMGQIYLKNKAPRAKHMAEKELMQAVQLAPGEIDYILDLAEFYAQNALFHRCRAFLDKAQAIELRHPRAIAIRKSIKGRID